MDIAKLIAVERITNTEHRPVVNDQDEDEYRNEHQVKPPVIPNPERKRFLMDRRRFSLFFAHQNVPFMILSLSESL